MSHSRAKMAVGWLKQFFLFMIFRCFFFFSFFFQGLSNLLWIPSEFAMGAGRGKGRERRKRRTEGRRGRMSSPRREMEGGREGERGEGESMHSDWEFICHSQAQSYFKRLTRDVEKGEMRPLMWNDMPDDRGRGEKRGGERPLWITAIVRQSETNSLQRGERWEREKTDRFGLQSYGSMPQSRPQQRRLMDLTPRGDSTPLFSISPPCPHPNDSSTHLQRRPPPPFSPRCLHHDSHPLPELNYRRGPSEGSITLPPSSAIIKQVYELRPAPDCIEEPSSAVFTRPRAFRTHTPLTLMALFFFFFCGKSFQSLNAWVFTSDDAESI